ncbi:MAG: hypothetical protein KTM48_02330, partial [Wolbachia endosymbiont of Pissodes strobi]|nr:hypothetical protein [Wolbachia endosymbiont of Pissodes strobi]
QGKAPVPGPSGLIQPQSKRLGKKLGCEKTSFKVFLRTSDLPPKSSNVRRKALNYKICLT